MPVVVAALWLGIAPTGLGGSCSYPVTWGISMQPTIHMNGPVPVRAQVNYHVGDVVLYDNQLLRAPVLHRIVLIQNGDPHFRGDNHDFVVALAATLITSFTASANVPVGNAGASVQLRQVSQFAPVGCGSLNFTRMVTGAGAFSDGLANALLLRSGIRHLHQRSDARGGRRPTWAEHLHRRRYGGIERQLRQPRRAGAAVADQLRDRHFDGRHDRGGAYPQRHLRQSDEQRSRW